MKRGYEVNIAVLTSIMTKIAESKFVEIVLEGHKLVWSHNHGSRGFTFCGRTQADLVPYKEIGLRGWRGVNCKVCLQRKHWRFNR